MPTQVTLMPPARRKLQNELVDQVREEVAFLFPDAETVSVYDILQGFHSDQYNKLILAVETQSRLAAEGPATYESHVVKLGTRAEVAPDVEGWQKCTENRPISRRMFVPVKLVEFPNDAGRAAVIYRDAAQWSGLLTPGSNEVATLAWAIDEAVFSPHRMDFGSVERIIRQVLSELGRMFYQDAKNDPAAAKSFYQQKLRLDRADSIVHKWKESDLWHLRRDTDWLLCGGISPASGSQPEYVDPYDFVLAMLERDELPATLVGPAHGDLHANNIIVGATEDEVEYPLLIDYGDMALANVVVWDFVKLETEFKVRVLVELFKDAATREYVWSHLRSARFQIISQRWKPATDSDTNPIVRRIQLIIFAFEFAQRLFERTEQFDYIPGRPQVQVTSATPAFDRAITLIQTIRYMAGEQLGRQPGRPSLWRREHDLALAIYGLNTVKYSDKAYPGLQRLCALVASGMAAARMLPKLDIDSAEAEAAGAKPLCYHVPLRRAYRRWKSNDQLDQAERALDLFSRQFDYAVPFIREHALLLAKLGRTEDATQRLNAIARHPSEPLSTESHTSSEVVTLCEAFAEIEVLARLGRIYKDKADAAWKKLDVDFAELQGQPPVQFYRSAYKYYSTAYKLSSDYYPGGNAAVTGLLCGEEQYAREIAQQVALTCRSIDLDALSTIDRYWVLATEGEMALLIGSAKEAAGFFTSAFDELPSGNDGMVQTSYDQLCRLYRALGHNALWPVLEVCRATKKFKIKAGSLGDCGGLFSNQNVTRRE